jgi:hypothetical protein
MTMQTNPYQPPGTKPLPSGDLLGPDFQPRPMEITFEVGPDELVAFNLYHLKHSPTVRRQYRIRLFTVPLLMALVAITLFLSADDKLAALPALVVVGFLCLVYLLLFPGLRRRGIKKQVRRLIAEGKNAGIFGQHRISITPQEVREVLSVGDSSRRWSAIERIAETDDHVFIYISALSAYIIPKLAFNNELACQQFIRSARIWMDQAAKTTYL